MPHIRISLVSILLALAFGFHAKAVSPELSDEQNESGLTAAKAFTVAPSNVIPLLSPNVRLDMLDFFRAGSERPSINVMDEEARVLQESDYSLLYSPAPGLECQMFILNPTAQEPLICLITTASTPVADSEIVVYNRSWRILPSYTSPFPPTLADWLTPEGRRNRALVEEQIPFILAEYSYDVESGVLTVRNNTRQYFHEREVPDALGMLRDEIQYKWNGRKFKAL